MVIDVLRYSVLYGKHLIAVKYLTIQKTRGISSNRPLSSLTFFLFMPSIEHIDFMNDKSHIMRCTFTCITFKGFFDKRHFQPIQLKDHVADVCHPPLHPSFRTQYRWNLFKLTLTATALCSIPAICCKLTNVTLHFVPSCNLQIAKKSVNPFLSFLSYICLHL